MHTQAEKLWRVPCTAYIKETPLLETRLSVSVPWLKQRQAEGDTSDGVKPSKYNNTKTLITEHHISNTSQLERAEQQYKSRYTRQSKIKHGCSYEHVSGLQCVITQAVGSYLSYKRRIRPQNRFWPTLRSVSHR